MKLYIALQITVSNLEGATVRQWSLSDDPVEVGLCDGRDDDLGSAEKIISVVVNRKSIHLYRYSFRNESETKQDGQFIKKLWSTRT